MAAIFDLNKFVADIQHDSPDNVHHNAIALLLHHNNSIFSLLCKVAFTICLNANSPVSSPCDERSAPPKNGP